jgi:hypothetical protein
MVEPSAGAGHTERRYEERDVQLRPLLFFAMGLVVLAGAVLVLLVWLFDYLAARQAALMPPPSPLLETGRLPPQPRLQVVPQRELHAMRREENAVLQSYGWVDRQAGIIRVPVARAMELLVEMADKAEDRR